MKKLLKGKVGGFPSFLGQIVIIVVGFSLGVCYVANKPITIEPKGALLGYSLIASTVALGVIGLWKAFRKLRHL